jgi:hypothetical protein
MAARQERPIAVIEKARKDALVPLSINLALAAFALTSQASIDPRRVADTMASDALVLRQLRDHGDVAHKVRRIEVYFFGSAEAIDRLEHDVASLGWTFVDRAPPQDGTTLLTVARTQTTEPSAIRQLSEAALRIEAEYGVEYDGWETSVEAQ